MKNGKPLPYSTWRKKYTNGPSDIIATPVIHKGRVYVAIGQSPYHGPGDGNLCCLDAETGKMIWNSRLAERTTATAAICNGLLFLSDYSKNLHCFDINTGERYWVHDLEGRVWASAPLVADDMA